MNSTTCEDNMCEQLQTGGLGKVEIHHFDTALHLKFVSLHLISNFSNLNQLRTRKSKPRTKIHTQSNKIRNELKRKQEKNHRNTNT